MPEDAPIAVIGLAYRAPGVGGKGIWDYLAQARSAWSEIPADRFDQAAYCKPGAEKSGVFRVQGAHFVPGDIYAFDAAFFHMRAEEAKNADPQQRMLLECALEAAEMAGHSLNSLAGQTVGVFIGSGQHDYSACLTDDSFGVKTFTATGIAPCMLANRLSYFFDVDGPSTVLDSACASSAYAVHQAILAIRNGDCRAAFAASASLNISPGGFLALEKTGALSDDGRSYSYDAKASGFGRGEGGACLLLKSMDDAIRDGDPIQAIIRSTACNHGGRSDGITMPNGVSHRKLLWRVHEAAGLDPSDTAVVEGHGTGTGVGDPIEAGAFTSVLARNRKASNPIYIGSIKSNMGHLEGASGMIGMIKAILQVKHGVVLPTAGFESINPKIQDKEKIRVPQTQIPWPEGEIRRILVTNFGFGGSNAAVLIDAPPSKVASIEANGYSTNGNGIRSNGVNGNESHINGIDGFAAKRKRAFVFSAKSEKSLSAYLSSFEEYLGKAPETDDFIMNLSYTLGQRRTHFPHRVSVVANSTSSLLAGLPGVKPSRAREKVVAFAFTGQGAQYAQMSAGLQQYEAFATAIASAEAYFWEFGATWSLTEELSRPKSESRVNDAEISQPACTAVQLALVTLFRCWGVAPSVVTGHSSGEIAAAFTAGLVSFKAACAVSYFRGQAASRLSSQQKGAMLAIGVGAEEASELIKQHSGGAYAIVAAVNSPKSVTISGDITAIQNIQKAVGEEGLFSRRLKIETAYHSRHMEKVADYYLKAIKPYCDGDSTDTPTEEAPYPMFVSSVTAKVEDTATVDANYWVQNLICPVRFVDAIQTVVVPRGEDITSRSGTAANVIIEIGPHSALKSPIKQTIEMSQTQKVGGQQTIPITYLPSLVRGTDGDEALLNLASSLFTLGSSIQLGEVNGTNIGNAAVLDDLPSYAWDKSTSYRIEARSHNEKLFPGEPYNTLIGRLMPSNGGKERAYRQVFTLDEVPWIRDHAVAGVVVFPMTGYIACAIEAARKTCSSSTPAAAFVIHDFYIKARMEIQEEQAIDMVTKIKPAVTGAANFSSTIWDFEISSWDNATGWTVHAHGSVQPEMTAMTADTMGLQASLSLINTTADLIEHDLTNYYQDASARATRFGPSFQNSVRFFEGKGYTVLEHKLRNLDSALDGSGNSPVTVDPPTLDGFLQGGAPLQITEDGRRPAQMPNYISRFRVSNTISSTPGQRIDIITRLLHYDFKGGRMQIGVAAFARDPDDVLTPIAEWESVAFRTVGSAEENIDPAASLPDNWAWELLPSLDYISNDQLAKIITEHVVDQVEETRSADLRRIAWYYINKGLVETARDDRSKLPYHLSQFVKWGIRHDVASKVDLASDAAAAELRDTIRSRDTQGEMLCVLGEQIVPVLRQEVEPLEIMLSDGLLTRHYEADAMNAHFSKIMGELVSHLSDRTYNMRILEVGAGTGGTTLPVLQALSCNRKDGGAAYINYTFTDISSGFFENARAKLAPWSGHVTFKKLDITQDPAEQGFVPGEDDFDVVIAANVLHATPDMAVTMANVRKLLKPRGKLLLLEASAHSPTLLPFFLLPGWWYAEDRYRDRDEGPLMPVAIWDRLLRDTGFSGVDFNVRDKLGEEEQVMGIMCATRVGRAEVNRTVTVCGPLTNDEEEIGFAQAVAKAVSERFGCPTQIRPFAEIDPAEDPLYIVLDSPRHSLMQNMDAEKFDRLKNLLVHNAGLLWVVPKDGAVECGTVKGIMRTLRLEDEPKNLLLLDQLPLNTQAVTAILDLTDKLRDPEVTRTQDVDFVWHEGLLHVPRMRLMRNLKEPFAIEQGISCRKVQNIWEGERALEMTIDSAGSPDSIYYRRTDVLQDSLGDEEVLVKVEAAGVSQLDLSLILGSIPWSPPGFDGAGTIVKIGRAVTDFQVGDSVFFLSVENSSGFATYKKLSSSHVAPIPSFISTTDAATMPLAYSMAIFALMYTARLEMGETVLVHGASGAIGQACITIAQHMGGQVYATAGTSAKREFLHESYGIPRERIFSSRTPEFRDKIICATGGKGVDVIVNSLSSDLMTETWSLAAPFGRFVEIGKKDTLQNTNLPMRPFEKNVTFHGIDLRSLAENRPKQLNRIFSLFAGLVRFRVASPIKPVSIFPICDFETGLRRLRSSEHLGKIIVTIGKDERVIAESDLRPTNVTLNPDATYMITGGTKGIGLSLGYWLVEHGAMNLVLLGRSGASGAEVQKLLNKYKGTNVRVRALACDVGSRRELEGVMECIQDLPRVHGVVHSALLLSDKLFENATYEDWQIIMRPRVDAAWHLHELLPKDMDFFIGLGSLLGDTGNAGQAIYAGSAAFYHEFSKYRSALGMHTVSIALPVVLDVGYVASNNLSDLLQQTLGATLTMADVCTLVKAAVMGGGGGGGGGNGGDKKKASSSSSSSLLHRDVKATACTFYLDGQPIRDGPWNYIHPVYARERVKEEASKTRKRQASKSGAGNNMYATTNGHGGGGGGGGNSSESWRGADDPLPGLTEALVTKVAAMTMLDRDDVGADAPLAQLSLDSLVSVELRNWIRREAGVELVLSAITGAESLRALAVEILAQKK